MSGLDMSARELGEVARETTFLVSDEPLLLLDRRLIIHGVNPAYEAATLRTADELRGRFIFDAFPDNPDDPAADGVSKLGTSLERVLRSGRRDRMAPQRYDVADPRRDGRFVKKVWLPVNTPILEHGRTVGLLHRVEDITATRVGHGRRPVPGSGRRQRPADGDGLRPRVANASEATSLQEALNKIEGLENALASSRDIGTAIGIVMHSYKLDRDAAWELLRATSQHINVKVRDLAARVIETGTIDL